MRYIARFLLNATGLILATICVVFLAASEGMTHTEFLSILIGLLVAMLVIVLFRHLGFG